MNLKSRIGNYPVAYDDINQHEVIVLHGKLYQVENVRYTQFFLNTEHPDDVNINVLCATSGVGNMVLD